MKSFSALLLMLVGSAALAQPPVEAFVSHPEFEDIRISPQGTHLAYTQRADDEEFLVVVRADDLSVVSRTGFGTETDIQNFEWANEERILFEPGRSFDGQLDFKRPTGEILGIDIDGDNFTILFGYQAGGGRLQTGTRIMGREPVRAAGMVIDWLPDDPRLVIVQSVGYGVEGERNQAWTMDVKTGRLRTLALSPIPNGRFVADREHELEFIVGVNPQNVVELYQRDDRDDWELIASDDMERWVQPIAAYGDDGRWLVSDRGANGTWGLSIWNPDTWQKEDLFHHPDADFGTLYFDNDWQLWAVGYDEHFPEYFYPDESHPFVGLHRQLRARFGASANVEILDETDDVSRVIVFVSGPQFPGEFLLTDTETGEFLLRMPLYPDLPKEPLAPMDPVELTVRDGQVIRGYLTLPAAAGDGMLPMVVLPHGGPHGIYDTWTYDFESQLLASRGYAVLQINFRGSGGRGQAFLEAGHGEWGGKMQDDLTDATRWAIAEGIADPGRICIYGGSYGAYAALTGTFREPDLYRCAIGMSGVYDLGLMFERGDIADAERGLSYLREVLGDDRSVLDSRSPVANAAGIRAKVMLIHGRQDQRAPFEHAVRMRDALTDLGKEVVWLTETGESHGIMSDGNRVAVYEQILAFLEQNIGRQPIQNEK